MDEVLERLATWNAQGRDAAVGTVVKTTGSTPRGVGAKLLVSQDGELVGSVSGGCVETDVAMHALEALEQGRPRIVSYGISDEFGIEVGLACGGQIEVLIEGLPAKNSGAAARRFSADVGELVRKEVPVVIATALRPDDVLGRRAVLAEGQLRGSLEDARLDESVRRHAPQFLRAGAPKTLVEPDSTGRDVEIFFDVYPAPPTLYIFGGVHIAIPLTKYAKILGYRVNVIDPRGVFATKERFAEADELAIEHPEDYLKRVQLNENTYVVVLTHDPKHDEPILKNVVGTRTSYIGAIGSKKTNRERMDRLMAQGVTREQLARVHAPVGLDLGAVSPEEIALSIMAEIVGARYGKVGSSMRDVAGAFVA